MTKVYMIPEGHGRGRSRDFFKCLKQEWGEDIYEAMVTALNEYNPSERYVISDFN